MIRVVHFSDDDRGRKRFDVTMAGFIIGGNAVLNRATGQRSRDDRAKDAKVLRALKALGAEQPNNGYVLKSGGGELVLEQKLLEHLMTYLEAAPFPTQQSDDHDDAMDFVKAAGTQDNS